MSQHYVKIEPIKEILPHPNADRLELAKILDWQVIVPKGQFKAGDLVLYIPIDSILPADVENTIFPPESKIKLSKSRIRSIKIRQAISQGLIVKPEDLSITNYKEGQDFKAQLGIEKFEPQEPGYSGTQGNSPKRKNNPHFKKYGGVENAKNYPDLFEEGEEVWVTEKIHGTNFRAGWVPYHCEGFWRTTWQRIKKIFDNADEWEFVWGSNNVQLHNKFRRKTFYSIDVYTKIVMQETLKYIIPKGFVLYGEIYGGGIQKGYTYGCGPNEHKVVFFDVMENGVYLSPEKCKAFLDELGLDYVPILFKGPFNKEEIIESFSKGPSVFSDKQKIREGCVVRPVIESESYMGRKQLKYINEDYLLNDQSDFH